jgi:hypothetical protein
MVGESCRFVTRYLSTVDSANTNSNTATTRFSCFLLYFVKFTSSIDIVCPQWRIAVAKTKNVKSARFKRVERARRTKKGKGQKGCESTRRRSTEQQSRQRTHMKETEIIIPRKHRVRKKQEESQYQAHRDNESDFNRDDREIDDDDDDDDDDGAIHSRLKTAKSELSLDTRLLMVWSGDGYGYISQVALDGVLPVLISDLFYRSSSSSDCTNSKQEYYGKEHDDDDEELSAETQPTPEEVEVSLAEDKRRKKSPNMPNRGKRKKQKIESHG